MGGGGGGGAEEGRGDALEGEQAIRPGMPEGQLRGVQVVARISRDRDASLPRDAPLAVEGISDQGVAGRGQVDADLVGPAGVDPHVMALLG